VITEVTLSAIILSNLLRVTREALKATIKGAHPGVIRPPLRELNELLLVVSGVLIVVRVGDIRLLMGAVHRFLLCLRD
jgi:hypothetical protein